MRTPFGRLPKGLHRIFTSRCYADLGRVHRHTDEGTGGFELNRRKWWIGLVLLLIVALISVGVYLFRGQSTVEAADKPLEPDKTWTDNERRTVKDFTVIAKQVKWQIAPNFQVDALTYGGTVPGAKIQVTQGERVRVKLVNQLNVPISIHWHGYPVPNAMDGVTGVTQDPVAPGQSFTYDFVAKVPGTYFYHSHYNSAQQVDQGLYGVFVVLPKNEPVKYDRDYTLVLDEWMNMSGSGNGMGNMDMGNMNMGNMNGMDHSNMNMGPSSTESAPAANATPSNNMPVMDHDQMMKMMYNVYTVNGKSGSLIQPLKVKEGEKVRLRFINAGYMTHLVHLQGQTFQVAATDGNPIANPSPVQDKLLSIGAGERYDVTFVAGAKDFAIDLHDQTNGAKTAVIPVHVAGNTQAQPVADQANLPVLDLTTYGQNTGGSVDEGRFDKSYTLHLNSTFQGNDQVYTINGKTWPNTDLLEVRKGERVKVTLINDGKSDHPMHLHGHTFQVLRYNGKPVTGSPINKDTLLVRPGETYEIAFTADNPGNWAFHCHDLHHASAGMMTLLKYQDYQSNYRIDLSKVGE